VVVGVRNILCLRSGTSSPLQFHKHRLRDARNRTVEAKGTLLLLSTDDFCTSSCAFPNSMAWRARWKRGAAHDESRDRQLRDSLMMLPRHDGRSECGQSEHSWLIDTILRVSMAHLTYHVQFSPTIEITTFFNEASKSSHQRLFNRH
jgi:hypothetical protein